MKKVLIVDNYDSFTYNLVHLVEEVLGHSVDIKKNDQLTIEEVDAYEYLILSPGPGLPQEAGLLKELIQTYATKKKILGVCLGLQAIGEVFGCQLKQLSQVYHGIKSEVLQCESSILFEGLTERLEVGRYHSWVIDESTITDKLIITSRDATGKIMSIEHNAYKVYGVQYHPESIMTEAGKIILRNFLNC